MVEGPPPTPGISIAGGVVFYNKTGECWPLPPKNVPRPATVATSPDSRKRASEHLCECSTFPPKKAARPATVATRPDSRKRASEHLDYDEEEEEAETDRDDGQDPQRFRHEWDEVEPDCRSSYLLFHTMGAAGINPHAGDGAYSSWMKSSFPTRVTYCKAAHRLEFKGGNNVDQSELERVFLVEINERLLAWAHTQARRVVLNWHFRFTGRPNAWTGRGVTDSLIKEARAACEKHGHSLSVIYTVHEYKQGQSCCLIDPNALIAVERQVQVDLQKDFPQVTVLRSRVPNLDSTRTAHLVDLVQSYLPKPSDLSAEFASGQSLGMAWFMRGIASADGATTTARNIAIFGSIVGRHGLSKRSVTELASALDVAGVSSEIKINIVGRAQDRSLADTLRYLNLPRVLFTGEVDNFLFARDCRYAISFDQEGFRDNASAMVNMIRAGTLLFCRTSPEETIENLCRRVALTIKKCERTEGNYLTVLSMLQPLFRETEAFLVANRLDALFALDPKTSSKR